MNSLSTVLNRAMNPRSSNKDHEDGQAVLPVDCQFTSEELLNRIRDGVPAATAAEYLARVRLEASDLPNVSRSEKNSHEEQTKLSHSSNVHNKVEGSCADTVRSSATSCAPSCRSHEWRTAVVYEFSELRQYVHRWSKRDIGMKKPTFPRRNDRKGWEELLFPPNSDAIGLAPCLSKLVFFDQVLVSNLLCFLNESLQERPVCVNELDLCKTAWIYGLLTVLEKPLMPDNAATLRDIYLYCASGRKSESDTIHDALVGIEMIQWIIADYFKQGD